MRLATVRTPDGTRAARVEGARLVELSAPDVRAVLEAGGVDAVAPTGIVHDVADAVLFLASPLADLVQGQTLVVDGGAAIHV